MPTDKFTGRPRGFAFVQMANAEATAAAIAALNESTMGGRTVYVSESLPKDKVADNKKKYVKKQQSKTFVRFFGSFFIFEALSSSRDLHLQFTKINRRCGHKNLRG